MKRGSWEYWNKGIETFSLIILQERRSTSIQIKPYTAQQILSLHTLTHNVFTYSPLEERKRKQGEKHTISCYNIPLLLECVSSWLVCLPYSMEVGERRVTVDNYRCWFSWRHGHNSERGLWWWCNDGVSDKAGCSSDQHISLSQSKYGHAVEWSSGETYH